MDEKSSYKRLSFNFEEKQVVGALMLIVLFGHNAWFVDGGFGPYANVLTPEFREIIMKIVAKIERHNVDYMEENRLWFERLAEQRKNSDDKSISGVAEIAVSTSTENATSSSLGAEIPAGALLEVASREARSRKKG